MTITQVAKELAGLPPAQHYAAVKDMFLRNNRFVSITGETVALLKDVPWPPGSGVYVVRDLPEDGNILYIGKTGKLTGIDGARAGVNGGALIQRLQRWTPYCFQTAGPFSDHFEYGPKYGVNVIREKPYPDRYRFHVQLKQIAIDCFSTAGIEQQLSPAFLEALLLQDHVSRQGRLPTGNQEF